MFKKIIAVSNPETKEARVLVGSRLASETRELANLIVRFQFDKSDAAREFAEGWGYNNAANIGQKLNGYEVSIKAMRQTLDGDAGIFAALGVIDKEVAREINHLMWELSDMDDYRWAEKHQGKGFLFAYPMMNKNVRMALRELPDAVYKRVYTMIVSPEEQIADNKAYEEKMIAYQDQEKRISDRRWGLRGIKDTDIIALAKAYKEQQSRVNIPNPRLFKDSDRYLTPGSRDKLIEAIIKVEFPSNLLLKEPSGYSEWSRK